MGEKISVLLVDHVEVVATCLKIIGISFDLAID